MASAPRDSGTGGPYAGTDGGRAHGAKTLGKGLRILWELRDQPDGLTVTQLARRLALERTACYRLLRVLRDHRLVTAGSAGYRLDLGLVELSRGVRPRLQEAAAHHLRLLADLCGATAFVTALDGDDEAVVLAVVEPSRSVAHVAYRVGFRHPADQGASGLAILAGRPARPDERKAVTEARRIGYSVTAGELQHGAWGLAAPIRPADGPSEASVGVVSIGELPEAETARHVLDSARAIAAALG